MHRLELEHVLRAAGALADEPVLVVVGSQAILGAWPDAPDDLTVSLEVDLYPEEAPEKAILIDGSIGEKSMFHETFGYYAHGVGPETATLPAGWRQRAVVIENENTRGVRGVCPGLADLAISKLAAGRPKDLDFVRGMMRRGKVRSADLALLSRELAPESRALVEARLRALDGGGE